MTLAKAFKEHYHGFGQVYGYTPFPTGSLPKVLVPLAPGKEYRMDFSHQSFADTRSQVLSAMEAARSAPGLLLLWIMKADGSNKWVRPGGLAVVAENMVNLPAMGAHRFVEKSGWVLAAHFAPGVSAGARH